MRQTVAILLFDDVEVLDFAGPFEVFSVADKLHDQALFNVVTIGVAPGTVRTVGGLKVVPTYTLETAPSIHLLLIPGGIGTRALLKQPALIEWVRRQARLSPLVASVCTGALLLAAAGLLDGAQVTTHFNGLERLRELAPQAVLDPSRRYHDNGRILTSAGISAGIDLSLHLVARLHGVEAALATARQMEYLGDWRSP
jgi:transcriptional regulator GlxA family with amidase domain